MRPCVATQPAANYGKSRQVLATIGILQNHTPVANHRARASLRSTAMGVPSEGTSKRETPLLQGVAPVESLRTSVISRITQLQSDMERYLTTLVEIADPIAAAHIQTTLDRAESRIAEAQESASAERSFVSQQIWLGKQRKKRRGRSVKLLIKR